eukprot:15320102-Heterocapsa_arctica.AAC.1
MTGHAHEGHHQQHTFGGYKIKRGQGTSGTSTNTKRRGVELSFRRHHKHTFSTFTKTEPQHRTQYFHIFKG